METTAVIAAFAALAQETRLAIFRHLVQAGPQGLPAGQIAEELEIPPTTLSFHLKELAHAGLICSERFGRSIVYSPDFKTVEFVLRYLTENCCQRSSCITSQKKGSRRNEKAARQSRRRKS